MLIIGGYGGDAITSYFIYIPTNQYILTSTIT